MRAVLVHHADAGDGEHSQQKLLAVLAAAQIAATPLEVDPPAIRAMLRDSDSDLVVVAGGDGTTALVIATAAELLAAGERVPEIALLPIGGLNNIACAFGIAGPVEVIAGGWREGRTAPIDVGVAHGQWGRRCFVEAVGFGALSDGFATITVSPEGAAEKKAVGRAAFRDALTVAQAVDVELRLDGERLARPLLMLEVLNLPRIGPRLHLAPDADPADGRLDVLMIGPEDRAVMLDWLDGDCAACCPIPTRSAAEIRVDAGFGECRLDDPKRARPTGTTAVTLSTMPHPVTLRLPRLQPNTGRCE
ncbi:diacylglycerol/lipid kinase family protein [Sphingomonas sp. ac-8]|uniref:diacylglycerol/lipid kinase family protein n=1 Tax=Sphingomonas sp. ac-8 TaxID=3242977 RepID=UPI003A80177F